MAKFLFLASYTQEGLKGLPKDGGSKRKNDLGAVVKELNGTLETLYFAFGENDVYSIVDIPDNVSAATIALKINASGAAKVKTSACPGRTGRYNQVGVLFHQTQTAKYNLPT